MIKWKAFEERANFPNVDGARNIREYYDGVQKGVLTLAAALKEEEEADRKAREAVNADVERLKKSR